MATSLAAAPPTRRRVLRHHDGLADAEIGRALRLPAGTIASVALEAEARTVHA